ncbi:MAG: hypothetical protein KBB83_07295, partial [Alphaproteobacteria bacterium]|nr:hypothetical protein [Alphaproteobacteria bacterium]
MSVKNLALTLNLFFISLSFASQEPLSRVPKLSSLCADIFYKKMCLEANSGEYTTLNELESILITNQSEEGRKRLSELVFERPVGRMLVLNRRFTVYLRSVYSLEDSEIQLLLYAPFLHTLRPSKRSLSRSFDCIATLASLKTLYLPTFYVKFYELEKLTRLVNLTTLGASRNHLGEKAIPLAHLTSLKTLFLETNKLENNISCLTTLTNLTELHVGHNNLGDNVTCLVTLTNLTKLSLRQNHLDHNVSRLTTL